MKRVIAVLLGLYSMPVMADNLLLTGYDDSFYSENDPAAAGAGDLTGISDTYYYYDPFNKTLVVQQTEWLGDGAGGEYEAPYDSTYYYTGVTFDNMCRKLGYCDDRIQKIINEMRTEYEDYLSVSKEPERKIEQEIKDRINADELTLQKAKAYTDEQTALMLKSANDYTDRKVGAMEKELSAGIASTAAMSSVEVSNVTKGEVSIGGGYGYYNSQSAVALGAAMGLTDHWSVNAAAGVADSNIAFRAGTNYKFKLF